MIRIDPPRSASVRSEVATVPGDADFAVRWSESSARAVEAQERDGGQGMRLMRRVPGARKGTLDIDWRGDGLDATIRLPTVR